MGQPPSILKGSGDGTAIPPFSLKGDGGGTATLPISLKENDVYLFYYIVPLISI